MTALLTVTNGDDVVQRELSTMGTAVMASKLYPGWDVHIHEVVPKVRDADVEGLVDALEVAGLQVDREARTVEIGQIYAQAKKLDEWPGLDYGDGDFKPTQDVIEEMTDAIEAGQYEIVNPEPDGLDDLGIVALRQAAKPYGIKGAWTLKSDELRAAIRAARG